MTSAGQTLADRYNMTKRLGDGTFGEVLLAKKLDTGDKVAIKRSRFSDRCTTLVEHHVHFLTFFFAFTLLISECKPQNSIVILFVSVVMLVTATKTFLFVYCFSGG